MKRVLWLLLALCLLAAGGRYAQLWNTQQELEHYVEGGKSQ